MKILIAPDKFRGALDAAGVAAALAAGVRDARPDAEILSCPMGDGGDGTGRVLADALGAEPRTADVLDPLARPRPATWWFNPHRRLAIIEMAEASGLARLKPDERAPLRTTSFGTGQLLRAAANAGAERVLLCVGGSATVDGGAGCLQALGCRLIDRAGDEIRVPAGGGALADIVGLHRGAPLSIAIDVLCDVDNPLLGPRGAAPVFAPQKGADAAAVSKLEAGLSHWAGVVERETGRCASNVTGTGAAGGLPFGLLALFDAQLRSGFDEVARHVGLGDQLVGCDLCLTGEGRIDDQTAGGKVVAGVARLARGRNVPTFAFCGAARLRRGQSLADLAANVGAARIIVITPAGTPQQEALARTGDNLRRAARAT